uniref:Uncharacterized protein n=1 Tax=Rhizophora mucronata TaxID=61149 RepID=A0A2P2IWK2_RHIMU
MVRKQKSRHCTLKFVLIQFLNEQIKKTTNMATCSRHCQNEKQI